MHDNYRFARRCKWCRLDSACYLIVKHSCSLLLHCISCQWRNVREGSPMIKRVVLQATTSYWYLCRLLVDDCFGLALTVRRCVPDIVPVTGTTTPNGEPNSKRNEIPLSGPLSLILWPKKTNFYQKYVYRPFLKISYKFLVLIGPWISWTKTQPLPNARIPDTSEDNWLSSPVILVFEKHTPESVTTLCQQSSVTFFRRGPMWPTFWILGELHSGN